MNTTELKTTYPLITYDADALWKLQQYQTYTKNIMKPSSKIDDEEEEVAYLKEVELFISNSYTTEITKIRNKLALIENSKKFDCSKIQYLPEDMIGEIKSYLEPELKFTRRFSILRELHSGFVTLGWLDVDRWLANVPKKLIIDLITSCHIYATNVKSGDKKDEWCKFIYYQIGKLFSKDKSAIRVDKLIEQNKPDYCSGLIAEKWFRIVLHIYVFQKYRRELESKLKKTDKKICDFKNKKIVVKVNL